jgi:predicted dehydrogenase
LGFSRTERVGDPVTDPSLGGGALTDLGVYPLGLATALLGELKLLSHHVRRSTGPVGSIRDAALLLKSEGDVSVTINVRHATYLSNRFVIAGEKGRITLDAPFIEGLGRRHLDVHPVNHRASDGAGAMATRLKMSGLWPKLRNINRLLRHSDGRHVVQGYRGTGLQFQANEVQRCLALGLRESPLLPLTATLHVQDLITRAGRIDSTPK